MNEDLPCCLLVDRYIGGGQEVTFICKNGLKWKEWCISHLIFAKNSVELVKPSYFPGPMLTKVLTQIRAPVSRVFFNLGPSPGHGCRQLTSTIPGQSDLVALFGITAVSL
ncbi:hypothetical protein SAY87_016895 [Trapa incisa]|uniref:Uncharacterized protein n=1 Tax=Trapa incisa TaxID=236973 RepID=A0AAN7LA34_9MYRT|nr:hypothetical protein SAY87_016895 [Trapa incisa]